MHHTTLSLVAQISRCSRQHHSGISNLIKALTVLRPTPTNGSLLQRSRRRRGGSGCLLRRLAKVPIVIPTSGLCRVPQHPANLQTSEELFQESNLDSVTTCTDKACTKELSNIPWISTCSPLLIDRANHRTNRRFISYKC